ncbi:MAG: thioredoxin family protein [Limisphaerales bacterium]
MKHLRLILILLVVNAGVARAELPAGWSTNLTAALTEAGSNQQPLLVWFTASWCGPCRLMARTTLTNEAVAQVLATVGHVVLDIDEHRDLAERHNVEAVPTFALLSAGGDEVVRTTGFQPPDEFLQWLTNSISEAKETAARQSRCQEQLAAADQLLSETNAGSAGRAAAELFGLCAERNRNISQAAITRLQVVAVREPVLLLDGLRDPRLAVRIQVANLLRDRLGDGFDVDPWNNAATSEPAIEKWRGMLSNSDTNHSEKLH